MSYQKEKINKFIYKYKIFKCKILFYYKAL